MTKKVADATSAGEPGQKNPLKSGFISIFDFVPMTYLKPSSCLIISISLSI